MGHLELARGLSPPATRLNLALENVLDAAYREHASGVDAQGAI